jgi:hypothetical protein
MLHSVVMKMRADGIGEDTIRIFAEGHGETLPDEGGNGNGNGDGATGGSGRDCGGGGGGGGSRPEHKPRMPHMPGVKLKRVHCAALGEGQVHAC